MSNPKVENAIGLYMDGIRDGRPREAVTKYTGARYTQHSTGVKDGVEGFVEFFEGFLARTPVRDIRVVRSLVDDRYVFLQAYQSLNNGEYEYVTTDFFDTDEDDRIIEHWDVISLYSAQTPSGHTAIDGPTAVTDLDKTEANKALVRSMITDLLMPGGDASRAREYLSADRYIQHGETSLTAPDRSLSYREIVLLVGQGSFVATLCRADREGAEYARVDLFRVEDGEVVEHWDNVEPVPPREEWVNSGKF